MRRWQGFDQPPIDGPDPEPQVTHADLVEDLGNLHAFAKRLGSSPDHRGLKLLAHGVRLNAGKSV
jgi:hypothetical protein